MESHATISNDILVRYAADAAREVAGVRVAAGGLPGRRGVRVGDEDGRLTVELHVELDRGLPIPATARAVQQSVRDYLTRMTELPLATVNVVVDAIGSP
jgi:uncharacterized alkaline shock family protein YloU